MGGLYSKLDFWVSLSNLGMCSLHLTLLIHSFILGGICVSYFSIRQVLLQWDGKCEIHTFVSHLGKYGVKYV